VEVGQVRGISGEGRGAEGTTSPEEGKGGVIYSTV